MLAFASFLIVLAVAVALIRGLWEGIVTFIVWIKEDLENKRQIQEHIKAQSERRMHESQHTLI